MITKVTGNILAFFAKSLSSFFRSSLSDSSIICVEDMIPADHLLRKIEKAVDFTKIYDFVKDLYCPNNGRPSIDPVVLFKMVVVQHLYGLSSLRRTAEDVKMNVAYRWFLGYTLNKQTPHFSTLIYNFKHRYTSETIENIFFWILSEIESAGYVKWRRKRYHG